MFYLILRALDTIEDDMLIPNETKVQLLKLFHNNLYDSDWKYMDSHEKDKAVLEEFPKVLISWLLYAVLTCPLIRYRVNFAILKQSIKLSLET